jgi:hypothetical protein
LVFFPSISSPASFLVSSHLPCTWHNHTIFSLFPSISCFMSSTFNCSLMSSFLILSLLVFPLYVL